MLSRCLVFKGGTCLRKCYLPGYRFSEDLDFTATEWWGWEEIEEAVGEAFSRTGEVSGIDFAVRDPKLRILDDEYGHETLKFTIYWRGPHRAGGSPHGLRIDITRNELVVFDPVRRDVAHEFSDSGDLGVIALDCYTLEEVMAEKVRAVLGQRIYAVSRDLYDIFSLREHVNEEQVARGLPQKLAAREVDVEAVDLRRLLEGRDEFEADWERNLVQLLPPNVAVEFGHVWEGAFDYVTRVTEGLNRGSEGGG